MSRKLTKSYSDSEEKSSCELIQFVAHSDAWSIFFNLEDNAKLYNEYLFGPSKYDRESKLLGKNVCRCFKYTQSTCTNFTAPCDSNFILECYGSICSPSRSLFFEQGIPPNYYNDNANSSHVWSSSSFYPTIFEHLSTDQRRGKRIRTNVIPSILTWDNPRVDPHFFRFEHIDYGSFLYREHFYNKPHYNFVGVDPVYGPFCISIKKEYIPKIVNDSQISTAPEAKGQKAPSGKSVIKRSTSDESSSVLYFRVIARFISHYNLRVTVPDVVGNSDKSREKPGFFKTILQSLLPKLSSPAMNMVPEDSKFINELIKFDEGISLPKVHKIGILYCAQNQRNEGEMYNNDGGSVLYDNFLEFLGQKVVLKGFSGYTGMLDTKSNLNGTNSIYTKFVDREIMFHVSTMIPRDSSSSQQITRKRYLGNDMVTIIFQEEGAVPFSPKSFVSQFQHVFIVIQSNIIDRKVRYRVAVFRLKDVPSFGPYVTQEFYYPDEYFRQFLLTKIVNAEFACLMANKFRRLATKTRYQSLLELKKYTDDIMVDKPVRLPEFLRSGGQIKAIKFDILSTSNTHLYGAITWPTSIYNSIDNTFINCVVCVSTFCLSVICIKTTDILLTVLNRYLVAWKCRNPTTIEIYHRGGNCTILQFVHNEYEYLSSFLRRIMSVSNIQEAKVVTFIPPQNPHDFIVDDYAIIRKLPQECIQEKFNVGDQILDVEKIPLNNLSIRKFYNIMYSGGIKRLLVASQEDNMFLGLSPISRTPRIKTYNESSNKPEKENTQPVQNSSRPPLIVNDHPRMTHIIKNISNPQTNLRTTSINYFNSERTNSIFFLNSAPSSHTNVTDNQSSYTSIAYSFPNAHCHKDIPNRVSSKNGNISEMGDFR